MQPSRPGFALSQFSGRLPCLVQLQLSADGAGPSKTRRLFCDKGGLSLASRDTPLHGRLLLVPQFLNQVDETAGCQ